MRNYRAKQKAKRREEAESTLTGITHLQGKITKLETELERTRHENSALMGVIRDLKVALANS